MHAPSLSIKKNYQTLKKIENLEKNRFNLGLSKRVHFFIINKNSKIKPIRLDDLIIKPNYQKKSLIIDCKFNLNPIIKVLSIYETLTYSRLNRLCIENAWHRAYALCILYI